jgi:hypothetical protein
LSNRDRYSSEVFLNKVKNIDEIKLPKVIIKEIGDMKI